MNELRAQWAQWSGKFAALTRRERLIVAVAVVFGGSILIFNLAVDPFLVKARKAATAESAARAELAQLQSQLAVLTAQAADPDAVNRRRLDQAKQELAGIGKRLEGFEAGMVPPARMKGFLEGLLARNRAIELLGLRTLPVSRVGAQVAIDKKEGAAGGPAQSTKDSGGDLAGLLGGASVSVDGVYQHGIEIRLAGSYNDLLAYLAELERMPQRVMWNSISLTVDKYPRNVMVLRIYTLSLDKDWLIV